MTLELGPALLLLAAVVILGFRLMALEMEMNRMGRLMAEEGMALEVAWSAWEDSGGELALVMRGDEGQWEVIDFPDETWLPQLVEDRPDTATGFLWRRRLWVAGADPCWRVERMDWQSGDWEWCDSVIADKGDGQGGNDAKR